MKSKEILTGCERVLNVGYRCKYSKGPARQMKKCPSYEALSGELLCINFHHDTSFGHCRSKNAIQKANEEYDLDSFIKFSDKLPIDGKWILVTNNITCRDNSGEISHLWLVNSFANDRGQWIANTDDGSVISFLTHWKYVFEKDKTC